MTEPLPIAIATSEDAGSAFPPLWSQGLKIIQQLAGERWTDYNTHDPGVTILEQLCYALTESIYKSTFPVTDYLASVDGSIDYERQALYRPEEILPCRPVTSDDYRKAIFDEVPEIDDLFLSTTTADRMPGLYTLCVRLTPATTNGTKRVDPQAVIEKIKAIYCENRNLCEDLATVEIITPAPCRLKGRIEISGIRDPADLLAEIYFRCARVISPGIEVIPYDEALRQGKSLETIFTGSLTKCGHIRRRSMEPHRKPVTLSDLFGAISDVDGVSDIHELMLLDAQDRPVGELAHQTSAEAKALVIPGRQGDIGIELLKRGKRCPVSADAFIAQYNRREFKRRAHKHFKQDFTELYDPPRPVQRDIKSYTSIQNHFPKVYGIGADGIPDSVDARRKAQARQLKAFLLVFDQMLADYNALLDHIGPLFSTDPTLDRTYFHQALTKTSVPQIDDLRSLSEEETDRRLHDLLGRYDNADDRRSRVLDYLLALYGETFTQKYFRHLNPYITASEIPRAVVHNKINLLKHLPAAGHHRSGGENFRVAAWENHRIGGMELKVHILLGLPIERDRSLTEALVSHGLRPVSDTRFQQMLAGTADATDPDLRGIQVQPTDRFEGVPPEPEDAALTPTLLHELARRIVLLQQGVINASFFRNGLNLDGYRVGPLPAGEGWQVIFKPFADGPWCRLAQFTDRERAVRAANAFCRLLLQLNLASEGLHTIEHILLRPLVGTHHDDIQVPDDFYPFRMSVLMPAWTARLNNPSFRRHAEDTLRVNGPAHLMIDVHWLDYDQMHAFEMVYRKWIDAKRENPDGSAVLDGLSAQLIRFILDLAPPAGNRTSGRDPDQRP
jgi:hypothetical protein